MLTLDSAVGLALLTQHYEAREGEDDSSPHSIVLEGLKCCRGHPNGPSSSSVHAFTSLRSFIMGGESSFLIV